MTTEQYKELKQRMEAIENWVFVVSIVLMCATIRSCVKLDSIQTVLESGQEQQTEAGEP